MNALVPFLLAFAPQSSGVLPAAEIDALVAETMKAPGAVGLSVAVAVGDEMLLEKGYGLAEVEHDVAANAETMFRIGSITKQYAAAAIVRLHEHDELDIDEDMTVYLPDHPTQGHVVTVRHLLTHTSGIPSYTGLPGVMGEISLPATHADMIAMWADLPYDFAPGERFQYNNSGYYLLGVIIESVTGQEYGDYLQEQFFEPLGLTRTRNGSNLDIVKNRAQGYQVIDDELKNDAPIFMGKPGAAGAIEASAGDLVRWQRALLAGKVVQPDSYEEMTTPFMLNDASETGYGFGLFMDEFEGYRRVQHGGGINGFNSILLYVPEMDLSVAVISNSESFRAASVAEAITRLMLRGQ